MPAIKYLCGADIVVINQNTNILEKRILINPLPIEPVIPEWFGFISLGTAVQFRTGRVVRFRVIAVSAGQGENSDEWIILPQDNFVLGWFTRGENKNSVGSLFALLDEAGLPITSRA